MTQEKTKTLLKSMRLPFLLLPPVSVFLGFSTAWQSQTDISFYHLLLVLTGAVAAHISVNTFNEYFDFRSGLDAKTLKTPFSGGSGGLIEQPDAANAVFYLAIGSLILTILIGFYFVYLQGISILPIGIFGVLIIVTYTQWINRNPLLCFAAPGLGFGPLMVIGTHFVLTGEYSFLAGFASLVSFFLVNNLLLLNQFPDLLPDQSVGRRHFPIVYGLRNSAFLYGASALMACLVIIAGVVADYFPVLSLISLIPMAAAFAAFSGALRYAALPEKLIPYMGLNVLATLVTPALLGISLIIG